MSFVDLHLALAEVDFPDMWGASAQGAADRLAIDYANSRLSNFWCPVEIKRRIGRRQRKLQRASRRAHRAFVRWETQWLREAHRFECAQQLPLADLRRRGWERMSHKKRNYPPYPKPLIPPVNGHDWRTDDEVASDLQAQTRKEEYFARTDAAPPAPERPCALHDCAQPVWMGKLCREHYTRMMGWPDASVAALIEREEAKAKK